MKTKCTYRRIIWDCVIHHIQL